MIELTKQEMEDIWNSKPVNYLKSVKAARKGMKKFVVKVQGYERIPGPCETFTVISRSQSDARWQAQTLLWQKHPNVKFETYSIQFL
jgi:hypothetical protein